MFPSLAPKTYQDVVRDLAWWGVIPLAAFLYFVPVVLPVELRHELASFSSSLPFDGRLEPVAAAGVLSVILIGLLKLHELYDTRVLGWRERYDRDYILPELLAPYGDAVDERFVNVAVEQKRRVLNHLFYRFASDSDPKISANYVWRFYYRVMRYWILVIDEAVIVAFVVVAVASGVVNGVTGSEVSTSLCGAGVGVLLFFGNRRLMTAAQASVRRATADEIEAIHDECGAEFEEELRQLHEKLKLTYRRAD